MDSIKIATDSIITVIQIPEDMKLLSFLVIVGLLVITRYVIPALNRKPKI